jgi:hypothetical protein
MAKRTKTVVTEGGVSSDAYTSEDKLRHIISQAGQWKQAPCRDDDELEERCGLYKNLIAAKDPPELPTAEGLAMFLGLSFYKLRRFTKGEDCSKQAHEAVQGTMTWIVQIWTQALTQGLVEKVPYIWYSKQWFEMREPDNRLTISLPSPLKELPSAEQVALKYADIPEAKQLKD